MRRPEAPTLRRRLLVALLVPLVGLALLGASFDYLMARRLAGETYDQVLASTAIGLAARIETDRDDDLPAHLVATVKAVARFDPGEALLFLVLDPAGHVLSGDLRLKALVADPSPTNPAFRDGQLDGLALRAATYFYQGPDGRATIVVAQTQGQRRAAAQGVLRLTVLTNLLTMAVVVGVSWLAVRHALRPLDALGARVARHELSDLPPMPLRGVPGETLPLVRALNRLMARARAEATARQNFMNDTAHQLRTPLAGLQSQLDLLAEDPLSPPARARLEGLQTSVRRLTRLTRQMLALARTGTVGEGGTQALDDPVDLPALLEQVASARLDAALAQGLDLGFDAQPAAVQGSAWMLREAVLNLVDNAIAYTPRGGSVTVRCGTGGEAVPAGAAWLSVEDDGPGIPAADRERVFQRFVRLGRDGQPGTGLGLAIVREAAARHGAQVRVAEGPGGHGTLVRITFPA